MRPPDDCDVCGESGDEGPTLVEFRPHEIAGGMPLRVSAGHPSHLVYLCEDHAEEARRLDHLTFPEARHYLEGDDIYEWIEEHRLSEDALSPLVEAILDPPDPDRIGVLPREELVAIAPTDSETELQSAIDQLAARFHVDLTRADDGYVVELTADGLEEYQTLSGQRVLLPLDLRDVLVHSYHANRRTPEEPGITREALYEKTGFTEGRMNVAVWYLAERNLVETTAGRDGDWWESLRITDGGRQFVDTAYLHSRLIRSEIEDRE